MGNKFKFKTCKKCKNKYNPFLTILVKMQDVRGLCNDCRFKEMKI